LTHVDSQHWINPYFEKGADHDGIFQAFNSVVSWHSGGLVVNGLAVPATRAIDLASIATQSASSAFPPQVKFTGDGDHQNMMDQLGIKALRRGAIK
jgi:hypothetical protein